MKAIPTQKIIFGNADKYAFLAGMTQQELEAKVGISKSAWINKRNCKTDLTVPEVERIAKALKVTINQLLEA